VQPGIFEQHFHGKKIKPLDLLAHPSLHLSPLGRTQVCEHVDWRVWRNWFQKGDDSDRVSEDNYLESNDYRLLVAQAEAGEGPCWAGTIWCTARSARGSCCAR
jgi:hypothetical protein